MNRQESSWYLTGKFVLINWFVIGTFVVKHCTVHTKEHFIGWSMELRS